MVTGTNKDNLFGGLRNHVWHADTLAVVYITGAFNKDTLKAGDGVTVDELVPALRVLGIDARPSAPYPWEPIPSIPEPPAFNGSASWSDRL